MTLLALLLPAFALGLIFAAIMISCLRKGPTAGELQLRIRILEDQVASERSRKLSYKTAYEQKCREHLDWLVATTRPC